jgi:hypothetical protein
VKCSRSVLKGSRSVRCLKQYELLVLFDRAGGRSQGHRSNRLSLVCSYLELVGELELAIVSLSVLTLHDDRCSSFVTQKNLIWASLCFNSPQGLPKLLERTVDVYHPNATYSLLLTAPQVIDSTLKVLAGDWLSHSLKIPNFLFTVYLRIKHIWCCSRVSPLQLH